MAKFNIKSVKHMTPKPGVNYSTDYYKQSSAEYQKTFEHIYKTITEIVDCAEQTNNISALDQPLKGFPKTVRGENYTTSEIFTDLLTQYKLKRDWPSGMIGRWNRLFESEPELQIEFQETQPKTNFGALFK